MAFYQILKMAENWPVLAIRQGQEDDVRIAQQFKPFSEKKMAALRERAGRISGPRLEDWKRNLKPALAMSGWPE